MLGVFYFQKQIRKPGAGKEVMQMPRIQQESYLQSGNGYIVLWTYLF